MSILNVNKINPVGGGSTITIAGIASVTSSVTSPSFVGDVTGAVTGNVTGNADTASGLSGNPSINTTGIVTATAFVPSQGQLSHRNLLTNGAMQVNQRGNLTVSNSNASRQYGGPDRFFQYYYTSSEEARYNFNQGGLNDSPYEQGFTNVAHLDVTTAATSIHQDHAIWTGYRMEAYDAAQLSYGHANAKSLTLSFWIKSSVTGTYSILLGHTNDDERYITTYTVNVANTWEKKTITFPGDTRSGKTISPSNGRGLELKWVWMSGTSRVATPNEWATQGNKYGASGVTHANIFSSTSNNLYLTGCQLEVGSVATPFEHRSYEEELRRCHRYFFNIQGSNGYRTGIPCYANSSSECRGVVYFPAPMRANPTFTGSTTAMVFDSAADSASFNVNTISSSVANTNALYNRAFLEVSTSSMTAGQAGQLEFRATGFMNFSAEL